MSNEALIIVSALVSVAAVFLAARLGSRWLYGAILLNLVMVSIFGAKLISVFGFVTNVGNVFYACVFLAAHFLIIGREEKTLEKIIWFGAICVSLFMLMSQFVISFESLQPDDPASAAMQVLFSLSPQIAFASIVSYVFAQFVNIRVFKWLATWLKERHLWLQSNGANIIAQLLDSSIFFTLAFVDLSGYLLIQAILAGWFIKTVVVFMGTPFLYLQQKLDTTKRV